MRERFSISDKDQNCWQLASIQITTIGLPGTIVGGQLAKAYGIKAACVAIGAGNLLLWGVGLLITLMSIQGRNNAIENIGNYLGKGIARVAAGILVATFLLWYPINIELATIVIGSFFDCSREQQILLRIGLGGGISLLSVGGIRLIRGTCSAAFPFLLVFLIYASYLSKNQVTWSVAWGGFSIWASGTIAIVAVILSGIVNLPTFFRHSRSKAQSILALCLMTIFVSLFQFLAIYSGAANPVDFFANNLITDHSFYVFFALASVLLFSVCVNLGNIYFASAISDVFLPYLRRQFGSGRYALIGIIGTLFSIIPQIHLFNLSRIQETAEGCIACLDVVLMLAFGLKIFLKHRIRPNEKLAAWINWLAGCMAVILTQMISSAKSSYDSLVIGICSTILVFMIIVFCEETAWAWSSRNKH